MKHIDETYKRQHDPATSRDFTEEEAKKTGGVCLV